PYNCNDGIVTQNSRASNRIIRYRVAPATTSPMVAVVRSHQFPVSRGRSPGYDLLDFPIFRWRLPGQDPVDFPISRWRWLFEGPHSCGPFRNGNKNFSPPSLGKGVGGMGNSNKRVARSAMHDAL